MITCDKLTTYLNELLIIDQIKDYCPNGLQVQGKTTINKLVTGVTASKALIDASIAVDADAILVHHGYFWHGESPCIVGMKQQRIAALIKNDIDLLAYHLPLDIHPEFGNNVQLAQELDLTVERLLNQVEDEALGCLGTLTQALSGQQFAQHIADSLNRQPLHIKGHQRPIKKVVWCTGAAQGFIEQAANLGADAYISGEISERTVHQAHELGIDYFACGHHATECYGIKALGQHLAETFSIHHQFIDIDNPV